MYSTTAVNLILLAEGSFQGLCYKSQYLLTCWVYWYLVIVHEPGSSVSIVSG
jgi:hypothetical protein